MGQTTLHAAWGRAKEFSSLNPKDKPKPKKKKHRLEQRCPHCGVTSTRLARHLRKVHGILSPGNPTTFIAGRNSSQPSPSSPPAKPVNKVQFAPLPLPESAKVLEAKSRAFWYSVGCDLRSWALAAFGKNPCVSDIEIIDAIEKSGARVGLKYNLQEVARVLATHRMGRRATLANVFHAWTVAPDDKTAEALVLDAERRSGE